MGTPICPAPAYAARAGDGDRDHIGYRTGVFTLSVDGIPVGGQLKSAPALVSGDTAAKVAAFAQGAGDGLWMYQGMANTGTWSSLGGALR